MTDCNCSQSDNQYPELVARTNHFRQGAPRNFVLSEKTQRAAFVRAADASTNQLDLWVVENLDSSPVERCVIQSKQLFADDENLSAAERARRERMREAGAGITGFSADELLNLVTFSLSGQLWVAEIQTAIANRIGDYEAVVDPRLNRRGDAIAFTSGADFVVYNLVADAEVFRLSAESADVSYGLADFLASEELGRYRGHWWAPDGNFLLVQRTDETGVPLRWIADPTNPDIAARPHRYPMAGDPNPAVELFWIDLETGSSQKIDWDKTRFEYLEDVNWSGETALVTLLSRSQREREIFSCIEGNLALLKTQHDSAWLDAGTGVPRWFKSELVTIEMVNGERELQVGNETWPLPGRKLDSVLGQSESGLIVTAYNQPWQLQVLEVRPDSIREISDSAGYAIAAVDGNLSAVVQHNLEQPLPRYEIKLHEQVVHTVVTHAQAPSVNPVPKIQLTQSGLASAVLFPAGHTLGSHKLPVVVSIYGGPHHSEVIASKLSYADDQWLANQGFAVVIIDNHGTPGQGAAFERAVLNDLSRIVLDDQVQGLQELAANYPDLDLTRVGITGWSFGGYLSALAVLDRPDIYQAAWAGAPVTDWALYDTAYTERYLGIPTAQPEIYAANSLLERANKLERPLMLVHGLADDNVLSAHSLQLSGRLLAAGRAHQFLPLAGVSHMTPQFEITRNLMLLMRDFFREHLG